MLKVWLRLNFCLNPNPFRLSIIYVNVQTVEVSDSDLGSQLPSFAEWFPNMRLLKLGYFLTLHRIDSIKFHSLAGLIVNVTTNLSGVSINRGALLLQQLPQLQSLGISMPGFSLKPMLNIIKNNRNIYNLKVNMFQYSMADLFDIQQLIYEHPLLIELEFMNLRFRLDAIILLISHLNALKLLRFNVGNRGEYDHLVGQLDGQWRSSFRDIEHPNDRLCFVQLER